MSIPKSQLAGVPTNPDEVMVVRDLVPGVVTFGIPWKRFDVLKVGWRCTLVRLKTGNLAVFLPGPLTEKVKAKVQSLGPVKYIITLSNQHHLFLSLWTAAYPEAFCIGMEGLQEKREEEPETRGTQFTHTFTRDDKLSMQVTDEFDDEFSYEYCHSHGHQELVFLHIPTGTLIEADVLFNLPATEQFSKTTISPTSGLRNAIFVGVMNTWGPIFWQRRFLWYIGAAADRPGFADSVKRMRQWNYKRIVPCHGNVIEVDAQRRMEKLTSWFVEDEAEILETSRNRVLAFSCMMALLMIFLLRQPRPRPWLPHLVQVKQWLALIWNSRVS